MHCINCKKFYIGQTCRNLNIMFKEYLKNIKNKEEEKSSKAYYVL